MLFQYSSGNSETQKLYIHLNHVSYLQGALDYADERSSNNSTSGNDGNSQGALIFLHAGTYRGEFLVIDSDIALIGMMHMRLTNYCL